MLQKKGFKKKGFKKRLQKKASKKKASKKKGKTKGTGGLREVAAPFLKPRTSRGSDPGLLSSHLNSPWHTSQHGHLRVQLLVCSRVHPLQAPSLSSSSSRLWSAQPMSDWQAPDAFSEPWTCTWIWSTRFGTPPYGPWHVICVQEGAGFVTDSSPAENFHVIHPAPLSCCPQQEHCERDYTYTLIQVPLLPQVRHVGRRRHGCYWQVPAEHPTSRTPTSPTFTSTTIAPKRRSVCRCCSYGTCASVGAHRRFQQVCWTRGFSWVAPRTSVAFLRSGRQTPDVAAGALLRSEWLASRICQGRLFFVTFLWRQSALAFHQLPSARASPRAPFWWFFPAVSTAGQLKFLISLPCFFAASWTFTGSSWWYVEKNDFGESGHFFCRQHVAPRFKLFFPKRVILCTTQGASTTMDALLESRMDDNWNVDGDGDPGRYMEGSTQLTMLNEKLLKIPEEIDNMFWQRAGPIVRGSNMLQKLSKRKNIVLGDWRAETLTMLCHEEELNIPAGSANCLCGGRNIN